MSEPAEQAPTPNAFVLRDYTLTAVATGLRALNVRELRERLDSVPNRSLFHHFWGRLLRGGIDPNEFGNDLAEWASRHLHDPVLAERLALVDPLRAGNLEAVRERVGEILDKRMEEMEGKARDAAPENAFHFLADQMVVYDTGRTAERPEDLLPLLDELPDASLFLHFVDPPGVERLPETAASTWIRGFGERYHELAGAIEEIEVFLLSPTELRAQLAEVLRRHLGEGRRDEDARGDR